MCRLFGLVANKPVDVRFSFNEAQSSLRSQSAKNPDGWGIAWYKSPGIAQVCKEPIAAKESGVFTCHVEKVRSNLIVAHVRKATEGCNREENTHPFKYEKWVFAHNGGIKSFSRLRERLSLDLKKRIQGATDSEVYFYWLLQCTDKAGSSAVEGIRTAICEIASSHEHSGLNFLLSDGCSLYAFRYGRDRRDYYSLFYLKRGPTSPSDLDFVSKETNQLIEYKRAHGEEAVLIASEQLTQGEAWQEIPWGSLVVVQPNLMVEKTHIVGRSR